MGFRIAIDRIDRPHQPTPPRPNHQISRPLWRDLTSSSPTYQPRPKPPLAIPLNSHFRQTRPVQINQTHTSNQQSPALPDLPRHKPSRINTDTWGRVDSTGRYPLDRGPWRRAPRKKRQKNKRRTRIRSRCLKRSDFRPNPSLTGRAREMKSQAALFGSLVTKI